jgi:hypothetical protein
MCMLSVLPKPQDMGENAKASYLEKVKKNRSGTIYPG